MPATACIAHLVTCQNHKYFRKQKNPHNPSRGISIDMNICSFSDCLTVCALKENICPVRCCSKFNLLVGNIRKALFWNSVAACSHHFPRWTFTSLWHTITMVRIHSFSLNALWLILLLLNQTCFGTKLGSIVSDLPLLVQLCHIRGHDNHSIYIVCVHWQLVNSFPWAIQIFKIGGKEKNWTWRKS